MFKTVRKDNNMLIKIDDNYAVEIKDLDQREYDMLKMCEQYEKNPFGAPNHLLMMLVIKLWNYIKGYE